MGFSHPHLLDSYPIVVLPELAQAIGLNEAIAVQQIHYWTGVNRKANKNENDGYYWTYNTYEAWQKQFPWWSIVTIKRIFASLKQKGLITSGNYNKMKMDRTKWCRVNYDKIPSEQLVTV